MQQMLMGAGGVAAAIVDPMTPAGGFYTGYDWEGINLIVGTNGSVTIRSGSVLASGFWYSPATAGIGSTHWVRFTRTTLHTIGNGGSASATTGWLQLNAERSVNVYGGNPDASTEISRAVYTVEIATASGGSPVVTSRAGYDLTSEITG